MSEQQTLKRPKKGLVILISVIGVLLVGVIVLLVVLVMRMAQPALPVAQPGTGNTVVDDTFDPQTVLDAANRMFHVSMSNPWQFTGGSDSEASDAYVGNSTDNSLPFYFEVVLPGSDETEDEVLYTSPMVPVGSAVENMAFSRDLGEGTHHVDVRYHLINSDNTVKSTIVFGVDVIVAA